MAQTLVKNLIHLIFSTKNRDPLILPEVEGELFAYMTGIVTHCDSKVLRINGTEDHVHLLISLSKNMALATLMENLKKDSSRWIKTKGANHSGFYWQEGYGAFSVSESGADAVKEYIAKQKEHHKATSFKEEFIMFLKRHEVEYDQRYIWT